jgi:hypothetical protein
MRTRGAWLALAGLVAVSCFLPDVEFDPSVGKGAAGRGGSGGVSGSAGSSGQGGSGGTAGKGGTTGAGGEGGVDLGTQIELTCDEYCMRYFTACDGHEANTYDDRNDCFLTCVTSEWPLGDRDQPNESGTIECRRVHAGLALTQGVDPHCFHSAEVPSKGICD